MKPFGVFSAVVVAALFFSACTEKTVNPVLPQTGDIHGRIMFADTTPVPRYLVILDGTNIAAYTDSNGYFSMFNVPPGTYRLYCERDTSSFKATVTAGTTTETGDLMISPISSYNYYSFDFYLFDANGNLINNVPSYYFSSDSFYVIPALDTIRLMLNFDYYYNDEPYPITLFHNNDTLFSGIPDKGRLRISVLHPSYPDTFSLYCRQSYQGSARIDTMYPIGCDSCGRYFSLTTAPYTLYSDGYYGHYIVIDSTPYYIYYKMEQSCDYDIYLVNDSTGDTCSWKNPGPDWGVQGIGSDNPAYSLGYMQIYPGLGVFYEPDYIVCPSLQKGRYSIFVKYAEGPADSLEATPGLAIELGRSISAPQLERFYVKSPAAPMHKGEVWYAGSLSLPDMIYIPSDSLFISPLFKRPVD